MTYRNWCRLCGECNVSPKIEPDVKEIIERVISIPITTDLKICIDCNMQLMIMINFISSTKFIGEMYQELESKEENYLFTEEIINEIRENYNLAPVEKQEYKVFIDNDEDTRDFVDPNFFCEELTEDNIEPALILDQEIEETVIPKSINKPKPLTKSQRLKKKILLPKTFEFICHICGREFVGLRPLATHTQSQHNCKPQVECVCGRKIFNNQTLISHRMKHFHQSPPYICRICTKGYWSQARLTFHESNCEGVNEPIGKKIEKEKSISTNCKCNVCDKEFTSIHRLRYHAHVHLDIDKMRFPCSYCDRIFAQQFQLKKHLLCHEGEKDYTCETCGVGFKRNSSLQCHMETHLFNYTHSCKICSKKFRNKRLLSLHLPTHSDKILSCDHCDKKFRTKRNLLRHLATLAIGNARNFVCHLCTNTYKYSKDLKYHITVTHLNEKQHACEYCDKSFGSTSNRKKHYQKDHPQSLLTTS